MRIMYCYIEPWLINQNIYLMSEEETEPVINNKITLDDVPAYLATCYKNKECDKIILHGSAKMMTQQVVDDIMTFGANNFGLNDINIEVIK